MPEGSRVVRFSEYIRKLVCRPNMESLDLAKLNSFPNNVTSAFHVLSPFMKYRVIGNV